MAEYILLQRIIGEAVFAAVRFKPKDFEHWKKRRIKAFNRMLKLEDDEKSKGRNLAGLFRRQRKG